MLTDLYLVTDACMYYVCMYVYDLPLLACELRILFLFSDLPGKRKFSLMPLELQKHKSRLSLTTFINGLEGSLLLGYKLSDFLGF